MNKSIIRFIDKKFYAGFEDNWDNKLFRKKILSLIHPTDVMLDLRAGSGYVKEMNFRNDVSEVIGIDLDSTIANNPYLHKYFIGSVYDLSVFEKNKFDVIICNSVVEHIEFPEKFVDELTRVLKPGGYFIAKTPNRNHYMPLAARLTPLSFHKWYNKKRGRPEEHTFPTFYKMNTPGRVKKFFPESLFEEIEIKTFEGPPSYLKINFIFYLAGWMYERFVSLTGAGALKMVMIFSFRKKG